MVRQRAHKILAQTAKDFDLRGLHAGPVRTLAEDVIKRAGRHNRRACPLKPILIVWLVVAMALYRNLSIANVFERLIAWLKAIEPRLGRCSVTPEAIYHARERLGALPLKMLYREVVRRWQPVEPTFHGFRLWGVDGSEFTTADTPKNEAVFGRHESQRGRGAYPQVRGLFLVDVAGHRIRDGSFMPCTSNENQALLFLLKHLSPGDLLLLDRGLGSFPVFLDCQRRGVSFVKRISSSWKPRFLRRLGLGDALMEFKANQVTRRKLPDEDKDAKLELRVLEFRVGKGERVRIVTDLVDPEQYPAEELARLYHRRWECEVTYKELKSQLVAVTASKQQTHFRSKSPIGVLQEAWGMLLAHTLVRELILEGAAASDTSPLEISFLDSLEVIKQMLPRFQASTRKTVSALRRELVQEIGRCRIDRPRRKRQCPRVVKRKMSNFKLKRAGDRASPLDLGITFEDSTVN